VLARDGVEQRQVRADDRAARREPLPPQRVELRLQVVGQRERDDERGDPALAPAWARGVAVQGR
jgi:hypothetical protein